MAADPQKTPRRRPPLGLQIVVLGVLGALMASSYGCFWFQLRRPEEATEAIGLMASYAVLAAPLMTVVAAVWSLLWWRWKTTRWGCLGLIAGVVLTVVAVVAVGGWMHEGLGGSGNVDTQNGWIVPYAVLVFMPVVVLGAVAAVLIPWMVLPVAWWAGAMIGWALDALD